MTCPASRRRWAGSASSKPRAPPAWQVRPWPPQTGARGEAISALVNLGYSQSDAARAVAAIAKDAGDDVGALVKAALKELAK